MKKKTFIIILCFVLLGSSIYVVLDLTKKKISVSELNEAADYVILASTHKCRCVYGKEVEEIKYIKTYEKNGKYYTEVYVDCPVKESIGEVITIESDENYIEEAKTFVLFINKVDNEGSVYTTVNGKSGIIIFENGRVKPLDKSVKLDTVDLLWNWAYLNSQEKQKEYMTSNGIVCYSYNIFSVQDTTAAP